MKQILFLMLMVTIAAAPIWCQTGKEGKAKAKTVKSKTAFVNYDAELAQPSPVPPPPPSAPALVVARKSIVISNVFKDMQIGESGVASFQMPSDLIVEENFDDAKVNGEVSWTTLSRNWKKPGDESPRTLEVSLDVTTWNNDLKEVIPELRPDLATPEHLTLIDILAGIKQKNAPNSPIKESKSMEIDGVSGGFYRADGPSDNNSFTLGWFAYRYYEGKPQRISLTVAGAKTELQKALQIIESLKLDQADEQSVKQQPEGDE